MYARGAGRAGRMLAAALALTVLGLAQEPTRSLAADDGDLTPAGKEYQTCLRNDGRLGLCLFYTKCYKNQSIAIGGNIHDYELRDGAPPVEKCDKNQWCCTNDTGLSTPTKPVDRPQSSGNCLRAYNGCPWCVALYRPGGDVNRYQRERSGLYCGGALIGPNVVLTSASCVITIADESVWARVPASAEPARNYSVVNKLRHADYNSGSHKNDFGFFVLNEAVKFATNPFGACVSFASLPGDSCNAVGFNNLEEIVLTPVSLRDGDCPKHVRPRMIHDLMCATATSARCDITPGAPVLCSTADGQGGLAIAGVVRRTCREGNAHLGKLEPHAKWLRLQLQHLGVQASQYEL